MPHREFGGRIHSALPRLPDTISPRLPAGSRLILVAPMARSLGGPPQPSRMSGTANSERLHVHTSTGSVPLAYVRDSSRVWLVAQFGTARWAVEILRSGQVTLELPEGVRNASCRLVAEPDARARVLSRFREKYGEDQVARWFRPPGRVVEVSIAERPGHSPARDTSYFEWIEAEFDSIAADYDRHILGNRINRLLRDRSLVFMRRTFGPTGRLLEIGCGSGTETVELLADGHEILAVDISRRMLDTVEAKARARGLSERLSVVHLRAGAISQVLEREGPRAFHGIYSTYGALNCEPDLSSLCHPIRTLLQPDGRFVAGVFNRWSGFEMVVYTLILRPRRAFGRHDRPVAVEASRFCVDAFAYSVPEFCRTFGREFRALRVEGVPVLLPPSDLARYVEMFAHRLPALLRLDASLGPRFPFNWLGDHFLVEMAPLPRSSNGR